VGLYDYGQFKNTIGQILGLVNDWLKFFAVSVGLMASFNKALVFLVDVYALVVGGYGLEECRAARGSEGVFYPQELDEVKELVRAAKSDGLKICLVGSGMSQNSQNNWGAGLVMVNLKEMNAVSVCSEEKAAVVYGNVSFRELEEANKYGLATKVRQASGCLGFCRRSARMCTDGTTGRGA